MDGLYYVYRLLRLAQTAIELMNIPEKSKEIIKDSIQTAIDTALMEEEFPKK